MDPNNLVERLELLILEGKTGIDCLYYETINISKQLLSMNASQEQQDNFFYGKWTKCRQRGKSKL